MSLIEDLAERYRRHIGIPWQRTVAGAQRVLMLVYDKELERPLRAQKGVFRIKTTEAGYEWREVDLTNAFAEFMAADEYSDAYFEEPETLSLKMSSGEFRDFLAERVRGALLAEGVTDRTVVAVFGVGSIFGLCRLSEVLPLVERDIRGRLAVLFPGQLDQNSYRLLDARDGWNYLAVPLTIRGEDR
ncbi:hypothetical protein ASF22_08110 [Methylobacterium sp. Leaf87]|uniref:BREX protein BrxB domain-containing protein n=1 Tax=Methylobacterium sp. Leaf87 TaxID=1736243 RepID=UPI000700DA8F|nr:BREX protein BrxB domain-containing protein [Methylobacterium sp. Leaf87]KQO59593.1 hypothetical protein ASF22_08110 [Methylobacterium sp. Leaf87]